MNNFDPISAINHAARVGGSNWQGDGAPPVSSVAAKLIAAANSPSDGQPRVLNDQEREQFAARIELLAKNGQNLPVLCQYVEGGTRLSDQINGNLRRFETSDGKINGIVQRLGDEVSLLSSYPYETYRAMRQIQAFLAN